jgi:hypothetical protein
VSKMLLNFRISHRKLSQKSKTALFITKNNIRCLTSAIHSTEISVIVRVNFAGHEKQLSRTLEPLKLTLVGTTFSVKRVAVR